MWLQYPLEARKHQAPPCKNRVTNMVHARKYTVCGLNKVYCAIRKTTLRIQANLNASCYLIVRGYVAVFPVHLFDQYRSTKAIAITITQETIYVSS